MIEEFSQNPSIRHLAQHHAVKLAAPTTLVDRGKRCGVCAGDGEIQGDPEAGQAFNVAIQPDLVQLNEEVSPSGGKTGAGQDDVFVVVPSSTVFPAIDRFGDRVFQCCNLSLQRSKCSATYHLTRLVPCKERAMS